MRWEGRTIREAQRSGLICWAVSEQMDGRNDDRELFLRVRDKFYHANIKPRGWTERRYYYEFDISGRRYDREYERHQPDEEYVLDEVSRLLTKAMVDMSAHARIDLINQAGFYSR